MPNSETTWSVGELHRSLAELFNQVFGDEIWVEGEIRNLNRSKNGHVYFDLIDSERADEPYPPMLAIVLFDRERNKVNQFLREQGGNVRMTDGVRIRLRGKLAVYPSRSSIQIRMTAIDPKFTLGVLDQLRQQVLAALAADDLLDANSRLRLPVAPTRVALVTSLGSAAHADAMREFDDAELGIEVFLFDARVQGSDAGESVAAALRCADAHGVDLVLVVRGGGARTDLAAFDLEVIARAIAHMSVPVFTGIGHEIDTSIADQVAHTAFKTPTAAAAGVIQLLYMALDTLEQSWNNVKAASEGHLGDQQSALDLFSTGIARAATRHLNRHSMALQTSLHEIRLVTRAGLDVANRQLDEFGRRIAAGSRYSLTLHTERLAAFDALVKARDPLLAAQRGWVTVRDMTGRAIKSVDQVSVGDVLTIQLADGTINTAVQSIDPRSADTISTGL